MKKFFTTSDTTSLQLPVAIVLRPIPHNKSTNTLNCTSVLIGPNQRVTTPIIDGLPKHVGNFTRSELSLVLQDISKFKLDADHFQLWQSTHSTINTTNPQMACHSTQVFFLFGSPQNCTDLNSTREFLEEKFKETKTYLIDYSGSELKLNPTSSPFEAEKIVDYTTQTQELFFDAFLSILRQVDQLSPAPALPEQKPNQEPSSSSCAIL